MVARQLPLVVFEPDGHRSEFPYAMLESSSHDHRSEQGKRLWAPADLDGSLPVTDSLAATVRSVRDLGFAILRGTPAVPGTVLEIAQTFGYIRETNYGKLFDVRVEANPNNLAFTGRPISPHTDNPYRDPVPTVQLAHCLDNAVDGGESGLLDGFHTAARLRAEHPEAFEVLTTTTVSFAWSDTHTSLRADRPMISVDASGRIREVRFNNRSMDVPRAAAEAFYPAYRLFAELVAGPSLTFRLTPGDCVIVDNTRLLHSRTGFADTPAPGICRVATPTSTACSAP